ncbi:hypothetical protein JM18_002703 [Phytophthora kernoviae]|uniref:Centromere/kinetochore protein zw10 n=2 Tax=Phytophthora kernoviae TaxID=325452 RepID=A0A8T0M5T7_9STRA|nr:hypothetical protein G195_008547 [Phytophthora kernoviae 00238/432]KAG2528163.1 hypothetical protein JM16_003019 [Phytophthora kernoviae]KAG2529730.1 hypothetical protein JM18_002703 [Phytophthora kernoviae]
MESPLDTLTRKLEETHAEIGQVRGDVVGALRSFYASSSSISADEAVKIAAKWGTSHSFPMDGDDMDGSNLQEKMHLLNVALLDTVGRLQLDESGELAPEAQLLLSFTQREKLKQQVEQSKIMLALIEQLTEMDRLLGDVDDAIDSQRFVSAAEGVAEMERLVLELIESEKENGSNAEDTSIVRVVKMQLLYKKNRLLNQLTRYFACTVVWQEGTLKVMEKAFTDNTFESVKLSPEAQRQDFWTACEVLCILTPKLKEMAKAISQYLIKPMLQQPHTTVEQIHGDGVITLKLAVQGENGGGSTVSEADQVREKCSNVVSMLEFVSTEVFAGKPELMAQLGEFMWKIPGNLEAQLSNLFQDKIPQDAAMLDAYRNVLATAVSLLYGVVAQVVDGLVHTMLTNVLWIGDQSGKLRSKKRRQNILSNGRDLMRRGYHDSVKITGANEKCNLNASMGSGKKGKGAGVGSDAATTNSNVDDVESSCFRIPDYRVTVCAHEVVEMVHQTLLEACTADVASAKLLFQTGRDLLFLFRTIVPTLYEDDIANDPRTCMLYHNDCLYITYHMLVIGHLYKHRLLQWSTWFLHSGITMDPLSTVHDKFNTGSLDAFTPKELAVLVKSLFRESPEKKTFLQELLAA